MASATEGKLFASVPGDIQHCNEYSIAETVFVCVCACILYVCSCLTQTDIFWKSAAVCFPRVQVSLEGQKSPSAGP